MANYAMLPSGVRRMSDGAMIPADLKNRDYQAFLAWQSSGGTPTPYVAPPAPVPASITFRQLVLGLLGAGFLTAEQALAAAETRARPPQLDAILAALPAEQALTAKITWATMSEVLRTDPLFSMLIAADFATAPQLDDLFTTAATL